MMNPLLVEGLAGDRDIGIYDSTFPPVSKKNVVSTRASAVSSSASSLSSHASAASSPLPIEDVTTAVLVGSDSSSVVSMSRSPQVTSPKKKQDIKQHLSKQQKSEQRFINSQNKRHQELMAVQKEIVAELVSIKKILNRNSTAFDLHNSSLHSIDESLIKQNELRVCAILSRRHDVGSSSFDRGLRIFSTPKSKHESPQLSSSPAASLPSYQTPLLAASPATLNVPSPAQLLAASPATFNTSAFATVARSPQPVSTPLTLLTIAGAAESTGGPARRSQG